MLRLALALPLLVPVLIVLAASADAQSRPAAEAPRTSIVLENQHLRWVIEPDGRTLGLVDRRTGKDHCPKEPRQPFLSLKKTGKWLAPSACSYANGKITARFAEPGVTVELNIASKRRYLVLEIASVSDPQVEEIVFGALRVDLSKHVNWISGLAANDDFAVCMRALNLQVNLGLGGQPLTFSPTAYAKHGLVGAKVAVVACPFDQMRAVLQEVVRNEGLPCSPLGGPFALDAEENRGSYVFAAPSEKNVDEWIALAKQAGLAEIHFCGWEQSLGHYEPRKDLFPNGIVGLKATVAKIHAAGLKAGMHTLTGCIAPHDPFASPMPDKRLAKDATFTLSAPIGEKDDTIAVLEPIPKLDTIWAYGSHGNVVQIDEELVQYSGYTEAAPYTFTGCTRGAFKTKPQPHGKDTPAHHLYVRYTSFQPDENTTLVDDVADCIARVFNTVGFDMIYMDGAEGMMGGWHGVSKMRAAIFSKITRRVLVEASEWGYHSWPFHSRIGAWDHPNWGLKPFIDIHCKQTEEYRKSSLLAAQLGWWAILGPSQDHPAETPDEIEYLCCKALALDAPMSFQGIDVGKQPWNARQPEYLATIGNYERLRLGRYFSDAALAKLREPKAEFRLAQSPKGEWQFVPTDYLTHKVTGPETRLWPVRNRFRPQPAKLRIQALYSVAPYDSPEGILLADFNKADEFGAPQAAKGITQSLGPSTEKAPGAATGGCYAAKSGMDTRRGAWARVTKTFTPPVNLGKCAALGVWVHGDGKGELLNFQLTNPPQFWPTFDEHYVSVVFKGWRYFELLLRERDAERHGGYIWPYSDFYAIYRSPLIRSHLSGLTVYYNELPPGDEAKCHIGPIKALPVVKVKLRNPTFALGPEQTAFPVTLESGQCLELASSGLCTVRDERGSVLQVFRLDEEAVPLLRYGENLVSFSCEGQEGCNMRALITIIAEGEPLRGLARKGGFRWPWQRW